MDPVEEIKMRLPIEELVGQYCQLTKKGRQFVCLCPFHNDTKPSMQVSPEKGIAYCFACNSGGDIFTFYQQIEGVDFRQAVKDLAEKAGVTIQEKSMKAGSTSVKKDEKERLRECLDAALTFYQNKLSEDKVTQKYVEERGTNDEMLKAFNLGKAPDSFSATYDHLLKAGFSRTEIVNAGLAIQKDLDGKTYDRFRNRLMFPIYDHQKKLIGFGGRTLGDDDAKYINSAESPLYHKSQVLFGIDQAKEAIRETKQVILVEGYFDVLACHQLGIKHVVAVCGTALTEQHVTFLKRYCETIILCLDQDRAGKEAAERAFEVCSAKGVPVHIVELEEKDPADMAVSKPDLLKQLLSDGGLPYLDVVLNELRSGDTSSVQGKRSILARMLPLLKLLQSSVVRQHYTTELAALLGTTETALQQDIRNFKTVAVPVQTKPATADTQQKADAAFSPVELTLGMFLLYPQYRHLLSELIEPPDGLANALYHALQETPDATTLDALGLPEEYRERVGILQLLCEHHQFDDWADTLAERELRKNIHIANRDLLLKKQTEIAKQIQVARSEGKKMEEEQLNTKYLQILKLVKQVG